MLQTGSTQVQTANFMNISQSVVSRLWARYQRHGAVADMQRSGRPRSTRRRDDRFVVNQVLRNRSLTSTDLQQIPSPCSRGYSLQADDQKSCSRWWSECTTSASCATLKSQAS